MTPLTIFLVDGLAGWTALGFIGYMLPKFLKWSKTMNDAESLTATLQRETDFVKQASDLATQLVSEIASFQTAVGTAVSAIQSATGTVPQAVLDAAAALNADGADTQNTLNAIQDALTKLKAGTDALNGAAPAPAQ